jgi:hypothetical protein
MLVVVHNQDQVQNYYQFLYHDDALKDNFLVGDIDVLEDIVLVGNIPIFNLFKLIIIIIKHKIQLI